ncbi:META domain-containing protein [Salipiger sp. H15]|uniref:META domain-containing protein n=1 Tax=Alloyangia sp. H15 TaxID=3029062 RepID=A0AAU8AH56_9RHOB
MVLRWILGALVVASGPAGAEELPVYVDLGCEDAELALTLQGDSGTLHFSGAEMPMARARTASGVKFDSVDDPETHVWTRGDEAMVRIAGQDFSNCRVDRVTQVTEVRWTLASVDGHALEGSAPELSFGEDGSVAGRIACGTLEGSWEFEEGLLHIAAEPAASETCAPGDGAQDKALLAALGAVTGLGFSPDGALELRAGDVTRISATQ